MKFNKLYGFLVALLCIGIGVLATFSVFKIHDLWYETFAAIIGVVLSAIVTIVLLNGQSTKEETKEKNVKIYENKIKVYSAFVSEMWKTLEDEEVKEEELLKLRSQIYNQLIFYISPDRIKDLKICVDEMFKAKGKKDVNEQALAQAYTLQFSNITRILREDLNGNSSNSKTESETSELIRQLWSCFNNISSSEDNSNADDSTTDNNAPIANEVPQTEPNVFSGQFWHFNMLGYDQLRALKHGIYELSLIEYNGEVWRTNLVKQAKIGDVVFLFRRGGCGYIGAYRVIGRRIMNFITNSEDIYTKDGTENRNPIPEEDIAKYDYYKGRADGADLCSNLIVEQLAYYDDGVSYPGGAYRKTISRYDYDYGKILLARLLACVSDKSKFGKLNESDNIPKEMTCKIDDFRKLTDSLNIKPAERDSKGAWI